MLQDMYPHKEEIAVVPRHVQQRAPLNAVLGVDHVAVGLEAIVHVVHVAPGCCVENRLRVGHALSVRRT